MNPTERTPQTDPLPLLLDARQSAELLGMSRSGFLKLHSQGRIPLPLRLSARVVRWRRLELERWTEAGCPARDRWDAKNFKATA